MRSNTWLAAILIAGCAASGQMEVRSADPPPPREEVVEYRPGFFWVHGHWRRDGREWHWTAGRYEHERAGQVYGEGRWEHRGTAYQWVDGGWRGKGGDGQVDHHDD